MRDILIIDGNPQRAAQSARLLEDMDANARIAGSFRECLKYIATRSPDLALVAETLPDARGLALLREFDGMCPVVIVGEYMASDKLLEALSLGARDFLVHPLDLQTLDVLIAQLRVEGKISKRYLPQHDEAESSNEMVIGSCPNMLFALKRAGLVARTSASVLIYGESGTGKELMAREIHRASGRSGAFVALNCAAVAEGIAESELFGHERGAFTGAVTRRIGCFEQADGGTLFLDEIGEASPAFQAKLLRALDRGEFVRVGGQSPVRTQVRVVAATNCDLKAMVKRDAFRLDLFYRLSAVTITLPPLRERREDIPRIAQAMLARLKGDAGVAVKGVSEAAIEYLVGYEWPGNLREMQHAIYRAALACQKGVIRPEHLDDLSPRQGSASNRIETLSEIEQAHIERVLIATGGNQGRACELLGVSRPTLRRKIRRYALESAKSGQMGSP